MMICNSWTRKFNFTCCPKIALTDTTDIDKLSIVIHKLKILKKENKLLDLFFNLGEKVVFDDDRHAISYLLLAN